MTTTAIEPAKPAAPAASQNRMVLVDEIRVRAQTRKHFNPVELKQLEDNIKAVGLLTALLVRPIPPEYDKETKTTKQFALVAGERRLRCVRALGWEQVECKVREMTDKQALELQLIENLQRADLDDVEEAEGYGQLVNLHGYTPAQVAETIGKSKDYVWQRLRIVRLPAPAKAAMREGLLSFTHARPISRLPHDEWIAEAVKVVLEPKKHAKLLEDAAGIDRFSYGDGGKDGLTSRELNEFLEARYMRQLKGAPFDPKDAELVKAAGPCASCPKRAGNARELFPDLREDMCTDMKCFGAKVQARQDQLSKAAREKGQKVMSAADAGKILEKKHQGGYGLKYNAAYVVPGDEVSWELLPHDAKKRPKWSDLLKGSDVPVILAFDEAGNPHELMERSVAKAAAEKAKPGLFRKRETSAGSAAEKKAALERELEHETNVAAFEDAMDSLCVAMEKDGPSSKLIAALTDLVIGQSSTYCYSGNPYEDVSERRKLKEGERLSDHAKKVLKTPAAMLALVVELLMLMFEQDVDSTEFKIFTDLYKIDLAKIKKAARACVEEKRAAAEAAKDSLGASILARLTACPGGLSTGQLSTDLGKKETDVKTWFTMNAKKNKRLKAAGGKWILLPEKKAGEEVSTAFDAVKAGAHCDSAALMLQHAARCEGEGFASQDAERARLEAAKYLRKAKGRIEGVLSELEKGGGK